MSAPRKKRLLPILGVVLGLALTVVPFGMALVSIARASHNVAGGLRGATHQKSKEDQVSLALGTTSASALLIPPGILLLVLSALSIAKERSARSAPDLPRG